MIIGFLGKGGSGKTTLATLFTRYLISKKNNVLAIDADHNMDFSFNLGFKNDAKYFGKSISDIKEYLGGNPDYKVHYREIFLKGPKERFNIFPFDEFTKEYLNDIDENLKVMIAGPHVDEIWEGDKCSHSLFTSLKLYLPYLDLKEKEFVVIDEKAGMDPVGTLVPAGFDLAVIVSEPTLHSAKTANQIANGLSVYKTPYIFVGNKVLNEEQKEFLNNNLYGKPAAFFDFDFKNSDVSKNIFSEKEEKQFANLIDIIIEKVNKNMKREKRATEYWNYMKK